MTDTSTIKSKKPSHIAYLASEGKEDKAYFNRIGAAWPHANGKGGFNIQLHAIPLDGKISLFVRKENE